jgi:hypothetical protein
LPGDRDYLSWGAAGRQRPSRFLRLQLFRKRQATGGGQNALQQSQVLRLRYVRAEQVVFRIGHGGRRRADVAPVATDGFDDIGQVILPLRVVVG